MFKLIMIVNKTVKVNIKKNIFFPRSRGKVSSNPPQALLEEVRNIATEKEIIKHAHAKLAAYKSPKKVVVHKSLAKNTVGKILKHKL